MEQFTNSSPEFSDDAIRSFLLGDIDDAQRSIFEEQFLIDDALEARVRLAELDLTDDYAFARLNPKDRKLFDRNFLLTGGRVQSLVVTNALRERFSSTSDLKPSVTERLKAIFDLRAPVWRYSFAALALILLIGTVLL